MTLESIPNCADSFEITARSIALVFRCVCAPRPPVTSINVAAMATGYLEFTIRFSQTGHREIATPNEPSRRRSRVSCWTVSSCRSFLSRYDRVRSITSPNSLSVIRSNSSPRPRHCTSSKKILRRPHLRTCCGRSFGLHRQRIQRPAAPGWASSACVLFRVSQLSARPVRGRPETALCGGGLRWHRKSRSRSRPASASCGFSGSVGRQIGAVRIGIAIHEDDSSLRGYRRGEAWGERTSRGW